MKKTCDECSDKNEPICTKAINGKEDVITLDVSYNEIRLSLRQLSDIKHALGDKTLYRSHYNAIIENRSWNELVDMGYAVKRDMKELGGITYFVTPKAIEDLKNIFWD